MRKKVLDASIKLLASKGLPAFNVNGVAALASVDLRTLHEHFPDRSAILLALYERTMAARTAEILNMIQRLRAGSETETITWVHEQIDRLVDMQLDDPAHVVLRRAMRAVPELAEADEKSNETFTRGVKFALKSQLPQIDAQRAQTVARTVVEAGTALIEYCALHPKAAKGMSREIGVLIVGYIREVMTAPH